MLTQYQALINATVLTDNGFQRDVAVILEGNSIKEILKLTELSPFIPRVDLGERLLVPGFIDIQVNGGGGLLFNDSPSVETIAHIGAAHRRFGTTRFLATMISDSRTQRQDAIDAVRMALAKEISGILGIHLEGPHLNDTFRGVHSSRWLKPLVDEEITLAMSLETGCTLMTLAPEMVSDQAIQMLRDAGIILAVGHTGASYDQVRHAFALGVTGITHLFNGMAPLMSRLPGAVGAALDTDTVACTVIADGYHVHDSLISLAWHRKPRGKLFLISDAMPPAGIQTMETFLLDGTVVHVSDGMCLTPQGRLAGSSVTMDAMVRHCVQVVGLPLDEVLRMASTYPAAFLNLDHRYGRIAVGMMADFVLLDEELRVRDIWFAGRHQKHEADDLL